MPEEDPIEDQFIHEVGELAGSVGLSRSVGQIYALLYMRPDPVSLTDIADACQVSKGTASMSVRELERWDAARKVVVPGERGNYYEANPDIMEIVIGRIEDGMGRRLDNVDRVIEQAQDQIEEQDPENHDYYHERLQEIDALAGKLRKVVNNIDKLKTAVSFF